MTTYRFDLSLNEQEFWAIEEAMKFYLTPEAQALRKEKPELTRYAAEWKLREIFQSGKLYEGRSVASTSSFVAGSSYRALVSVVPEVETNLKVALTGELNKRMMANADIINNAMATIQNQFMNDPAVTGYFVDSLIEILSSPKDGDMKLLASHLLEDEHDRAEFFTLFGTNLYREIHKANGSLF